MTISPRTNKPFTTEDADRLLGLADQFIEDWAEDAIHGGKRDADYEQRNAEWEAIRPLLVQAPALLDALEDLLGDVPEVQGGVCQYCGRDYIRHVSRRRLPRVEISGAY